jgi:RNA polymerase sigma-70 factor (ECF subfamily)
MSDDPGPDTNGAAPPPEKGGAELENTLELVRQAQRGDLASYERLFARYFLRVRQIVRARLGVRLRRELDSEDLVQESMVEAIRGFRDFEIESRHALVALFVAIVENRLRANARRTVAQRRDRDREITLAHLRDSMASGTIDLSPADDAPLPPELVAEAERRVRIRAALELLDERDRELIELRNFRGLSWDEVAARLGSPTANAARMSHARALLRLRGELGDGDGFREQP